MFKLPEDKYRVQMARFGDEPTSNLTHPDCGGFLLPPKIGARRIFVYASTGFGWEHVSVSIREGRKVKTPTWEEMAHVKHQFWDAEDCVMQLHPARSGFVNNQENTLHLWRPLEAAIPTPPSLMVGTKESNSLSLEETKQLLSMLADTREQIQCGLAKAAEAEAC